ncbi:lymphocyte antigen 6E [Microcaecilia unicolor]|uniref:Lymphocyte antigen 6E-like n=1 Tax=Microcaecilia unicolor TaxID=1415580 RepID=A0A6P7ZLI9_9AMPH|nr:lymphocyte antigen 6E-like [Microcaecilia unicolor]
MKLFLLCLLAAALSVKTVHSLTCFTCDNQSSNWKCLQPTKCDDSASYCMTTTTSGGIGSYTSFSMSKSCARICVPTNIDVGVAGTSVNCCQSDLCNYSSATNVKKSYLTLSVSAIFLVLLLWTGL